MRILSLLFALMHVSGPAAAHEFWISPDKYSIEPGVQLVADIRVGQSFKGATYAYLPVKFERFDLVIGDAVVPVEGRLGDKPALAMQPLAAGLVTIVHQTTDYFLTYSQAEKFESFVTHKDFAWALSEHKARGLPATGFRERYSRYAKSLVAVGDGTGADREVGMETEIVALANPYTDNLSGGLPVQVLYQGAPRGDTQVELFEKAPDGSVTATLLRTNGDGRVAIPVRAGHEYLVDAVVFRALEPVADRDPVWESLWASLTFLAPTSP